MVRYQGVVKYRILRLPGRYPLCDASGPLIGRLCVLRWAYGLMMVTECMSGPQYTLLLGIRSGTGNRVIVQSAIRVWFADLSLSKIACNSGKFFLRDPIFLLFSHCQLLAFGSSTSSGVCCVPEAVKLCC